MFIQNHYTKNRLMYQSEKRDSSFPISGIVAVSLLFFMLLLAQDVTFKYFCNVTVIGFQIIIA